MKSKDNVLYFHSLDWVVSFECVRKRIIPNIGESQSHQQLSLLCCAAAATSVRELYLLRACVHLTD